MATQKQKKAFDKSLENGGNISKAMRESDYSPAMAKNPQKLTESKGWQELLDTYLPDDLLAKVHLEGLAATKKNPFPEGPDDITQPDYPTREKYLKLGYQVKGKKMSGDEEKTPQSVTVVMVNYGDNTPVQVQTEEVSDTTS